MNRSEFVIEKDQCGTSCMFLKTIENDGTETYRFLRSKDHNNGVRFGAYDITKDGYIIERPEGEEGYGLFDVHMTPDCKKAVSNMIMKAKDKFKEWYENQ